MGRVGEQIGWMLESRGSIELVVRIDKAQPFQEPTRRDILRVMAGEDRPDPTDSERMLDDRRGRLESIALSPVPRRDMHAEFSPHARRSQEGKRGQYWMP